MNNEEQQVAEAYAIDTIVNTAVAENSLNPQNIEAQIRQGYFPRLFSLLNLDDAKAMMEQIIDIVHKGAR